jgi:anaerobic magnesium-protoporphyrin IX monomethyl ester cyclase
MARVMLIQPWNFHDEGVADHDLSRQWRNGPYSLLLLATQLRRHGHEVELVDMIRDLVVLKGDLSACLGQFAQRIEKFAPDILGFGFFSIHYFEVKRAVQTAREACARRGLKPLFIAGGIHASTEPVATIRELGFDLAFKGEADLGLVALADGQAPATIAGVVGPDGDASASGEEIAELDDLPFPDWSMCDHRFYAHPTLARMQIQATSSLDMIMSRGCVYKCAFCAYNALSAFRYYSAEYLVEQVAYMHGRFDVPGIYFTDSTIGNNRRVVTAFCEKMISRGLHEKVQWLANIRPNQVNEKVLRLMWRAGCRYLFYGFESGSQRMLDRMAKSISLEANYKAAELHNRLQFPYNASMLLGYPGETEQDIRLTMDFLLKTRPPSIGVNWYVPLPGSPDYDKLKREGVIDTDDPQEWRRIGEVNKCRVYADVPEKKFRELFAQTEQIAYHQIPRMTMGAWGCTAPPQSEATDAPDGARAHATYGHAGHDEAA